MGVDSHEPLWILHVYLVLFGGTSLLGLLWRVHTFKGGYDLVAMLCSGVCGEDRRRSLACAEFNDAMYHRWYEMQ